MSKWTTRLLVLVFVSAASIASATRGRAEDVKIDNETFAGLEARAIGPAAMGGRIAALDAHQGQRLTIYVGAAGGGVWKSRDGGTTFKPVFEKHTQSIGAIAIDPSDTNTVWVGTGESWTRNSVSLGDGIYRTTDGGDNWQKMGLEESERIARIAVDPRHHETVFVAATGHLWNAGPQRGVYRTKDAGKTWQRVLFVDENTGCADLVLDPANSSTVYAAMWQFRRTPWSFVSGGPGSGLYKSTDGGDTWKRLSNGLPSGILGRISLAISPARSKTVYAVVEAKRSALFRSDDGGGTWKEKSSGANITLRPFYFGRLVADPTFADRLYKPGVFLSASDDGGATFTGLGGGVHSDMHALWINPTDSEQLVVGTDGGVYMSMDRGNTWRFLSVLPVSQFYHVSYDMEWPYNVYGGLQDNGSWMGPSHRTGGIGNRHWRTIGGGDGFWAFVDPGDPDISYVEYQGGHLSRVRKSTGESKEIYPYRRGDEPRLRFNWNTPFLVTAGHGGSLYVGAQFLYRSRDRGDNWEKISPDLTTNDPAKQKQEESGGVSVDNSSAENHCTIFTIGESPKNPDLVWVGTDDGNIQVTRDGGKSWTNVTRNLAGVPPATWVSRVTASRFAEGTAYATFDGHATGDMKPYVYRTTDYGKTWTPLATPALKGYAHVVVEDSDNSNLLFVGTELGLFVSVDGGKQWGQFTAGLPNVSVRDIAIHPRDSDLIVATHGRGIYIVDDITPLRHLTPEVLAADAVFLESRPSPMFIPSGEQRFDGDAEFVGQAREEAAFITYYLKKRHLFGDLKLEVYDGKGNLVTTLPAGKRRGINRAQWPMRLKPPRVPPAANLVPQPYSFLGPRVPEGTYTVKLIRDKNTYASQVTLVPDPRASYTAEDRALQQQIVHRLYDMLGELTYVTDAVIAALDQTRARAAALPARDATAKKLTLLAGRLEDLRKTLSATREGRLTGEEQLREKLAALYGAVNGYDGRPTGSQVEYTSLLDGELKAARTRFEDILTKELPSMNADLTKKKIEPIKALTRQDWGRLQKG